MSAIPPPQGMTDVDYEAIEAAVTETVRGRWFLREFERRHRGAEVKLMLDAMARLETLVTTNQTASLLAPQPSADPSIRMLIQRIKEIAARLDGLAHHMREDGVEDRYAEAVDLEARAVAGLMRAGTMPRPAAAPEARPPARLQERDAGRMETAPPSALPAALKEPETPAITTPISERHPPEDLRLHVFSGLDGLPLAQKLALFT